MTTTVKDLEAQAIRDFHMGLLNRAQLLNIIYRLDRISNVLRTQKI